MGVPVAIDYAEDLVTQPLVEGGSLKAEGVERALATATLFRHRFECVHQPLADAAAPQILVHP